MKMKYVLLLLSLVCSVCMSAQSTVEKNLEKGEKEQVDNKPNKESKKDKENKKDKKKKSKESETGNAKDIPLKEVSGIEYMTPSDEVDEQNRTIRNLNNRIHELEQETESLQNKIREHVQTIQLKDEEISSLTSYKNKYESLQGEVGKLDALIYKQCLLYPLEVKYKKETIDEAIRSVNEVEKLLKNPSEKFKKMKSVYYGFLQSYSSYNQQLISCLNLHRAKVEATGWKIAEVHRQQFTQDIKELSYYKYYLKRNNPPYESILYLDEVIDKYFKLLKKTDDVEADYQEILDSLQPKNNSQSE